MTTVLSVICDACDKETVVAEKEALPRGWHRLEWYRRQAKGNTTGYHADEFYFEAHVCAACAKKIANQLH